MTMCRLQINKKEQEMPRMPIRQHNDAVYDFWELQKEFNYSLNPYYGLNDILNDFNKHIELIEEYRKNINDNSINKKEFSKIVAEYEEQAKEKYKFFLNLNKLLISYSEILKTVPDYNSEEIYREFNNIYEKLQFNEKIEQLKNNIQSIISNNDTKIKEKCFDEILSNMVLCPSGEFLMGSPKDESERSIDEKQHKVVFSNDFYIGKYAVTIAQYETFVKSNVIDQDVILNKTSVPITNISWFEAKEFCNVLNKLFSEKIPKGYKFDLPTEAQWEYACRAGTTKSFNNDSDLSDNIEQSEKLDELGWYDCRKNFNFTKVKPNGLKKPNFWGLYDMHGNVWEWCCDWYDDYNLVDYIDPKGSEEGKYKVIRGGCIESYACDCLSAKRNYEEPDVKDKCIGFRLALVADF